MTVAQALEKVREKGDGAETIYMLPVTDNSLVLVGVTSLKNLVLSERDTFVNETMTAEVYSARADEDQEKAARLVQEADETIRNETKLSPLREIYRRQVLSFGISMEPEYRSRGGIVP